MVSLAKIINGSNIKWVIMSRNTNYKGTPAVRIKR